MKTLRPTQEYKLIAVCLPICGCGTPDDCYEWVLNYLEDLDNDRWDKYDYDDPNWKLIQIINGFLDDRGLVEHGTTCRCSWLTEKGKELLKALRHAKEHNYDFSGEEDEWCFEEV